MITTLMPSITRIAASRHVSYSFGPRIVAGLNDPSVLVTQRNMTCPMKTSQSAPRQAHTVTAPPRLGSAVAAPAPGKNCGRDAPMKDFATADAMPGSRSVDSAPIVSVRPDAGRMSYFSESRRAVWAASLPGSPHTPPTGWVPAPLR